MQEAGLLPRWLVSGDLTRFCLFLRTGLPGAAGFALIV